MSDALSFAEMAGQEVELLPARTVLSYYGGGYWHYFWPYGGDSDATAVNSNYNYNEIHNSATGGTANNSFSLLGPPPPPPTPTPAPGPLG